MINDLIKKTFAVLISFFLLTGCGSEKLVSSADSDANKGKIAAGLEMGGRPNSNKTQTQNKPSESGQSSRESPLQTNEVPIETNQRSETKTDSLVGDEKECYEKIKKAIESNSEYIIKFSSEKSEKGSVKYDFNNDGNFEMLRYSTQLGKNQSGFDTTMKCKIQIGDYTIEKEYTSNYEISGGLNYLAVVDINKNDNFVEFFISDGEMSNNVTNKFYRLSDKGIEEVCEIDTLIQGYSGTGQIYYWEGCLYDKRIDEKFNPDLVLVYYDINKRKYVRTNQIIGKTLIANGQFFIYKTNEDVVSGAPIQDEEILKLKKDRILKIVNPDEKFVVTKIEDETAFDTKVIESSQNIYFIDKGIKVRTEDGVEGWIGGFHMVWD